VERKEIRLPTLEPSDFDLMRRGNATLDSTVLPPRFREAKQTAREEEMKKRDSILESILRFEEEVKMKLFADLDKNLLNVWKIKAVDGFLSFMEEIHDYQFNNDVIIKSLDRSLRYYMETTLRDLFSHPGSILMMVPLLELH
jgi:hypothetical protein